MLECIYHLQTLVSCLFWKDFELVIITVVLLE